MPVTPEATDFASWEQAGRYHAQRSENSIWEIAWWLVEGQTRDFDPGFSRSMVILKRARSTIENYYRVGRAYPRGKNNTALSFDTHRALLREPDEAARALVLCMTLENNWYANDVQRYFDANPPSGRALVGHDRVSRNPKRTPYVARKREVYVGSHVKCPCGCEHVFPIKGNKVAGPGAVRGEADAVVAEVAS